MFASAPLDCPAHQVLAAGAQRPAHLQKTLVRQGLFLVLRGQSFHSRIIILGSPIPSKSAKCRRSRPTVLFLRESRSKCRFILSRAHADVSSPVSDMRSIAKSASRNMKRG